MASTTDNLTTNSSITGLTDSAHSSGSKGAVKQRFSDATGRVRETADKFGRSAAENIDKNLDKTAGALHNAASTLRERTTGGSGRMSGMAHTAADKLDATATYFERHHTREMVSDLEHAVRRNPGAWIGGAVGLGFLIGMAMKRDRY